MDDQSGYGLINAAKAVALATQTTGKWVGKKQTRRVNWVLGDLGVLDGIEVSSDILAPVTPILDAPSAIPEPTAAMTFGMLMLGGLRRPCRRRL